MEVNGDGELPRWGLEMIQSSGYKRVSLFAIRRSQRAVRSAKAEPRKPGGDGRVANSE